MKKLVQFAVISFGCCLSGMSLAQGKFSNCSTAFVGRQMVVDTYTHHYSNKIYREVPVERVLATCKKGDHIVLLTVDNRYSLPHNEILVK